MRGCPPSAKPTAAPSARNWSCCVNTSPRSVISWSASTSTTGIPAPDWTGSAWTPCVMPPRPGSSNGCGACRRTGSPAPRPTRCWCSMSWTASVSWCRSPTPREWPPTTRKPPCSPRSKASSLNTRKPRSPNATGAANCLGPAPARSSPGRLPTATAASRSAATGAAHHEVYEPEAAVVRRIFADRAAGITVREICRRLNADGVP